MKTTRILTHEAIVAKINRMAYEIAERNFGEKQLVFVGVDVRGSFVARRLMEKLKEIVQVKTQFIHALRDAKSGAITLDHKTPGKLLEGKTVLLVDDVLYSGKTLFNALVAVMTHAPGQVQTALLIDRGHRSLPLSPDFVGLVLATTLKQHVNVKVSRDGETAEAFLQ